MSEVKIIGAVVQNVPWQDRPEDAGSSLPVWRYNENPIIDVIRQTELPVFLTVQ